MATITDRNLHIISNAICRWDRRDREHARRGLAVQGRDYRVTTQRGNRKGR